jgi:Zn-dependent protease
MLGKSDVSTRGGFSFAQAGFARSGAPAARHVRDLTQLIAKYPIVSVLLSVLGYAFLGPLAALVLVATLLDHEFAHRYMMRRLGYMPGPVRLIPLMGAFVRAGRPMLRSADIALIYLAGPLAGILSCEAAVVLASQTLDATLSHQVYVGATVAIGLNLMNLLPYEPLDGGLVSRVLPYPTIVIFPALLALWLLHVHQLMTPVGIGLLYFIIWASVRKLKKWDRYVLALRARLHDGDVTALRELRASFDVPLWERLLVTAAYALLVVGGAALLHETARISGLIG